jgi:hypothetical protein
MVCSAGIKWRPFGAKKLILLLERSWKRYTSKRACRVPEMKLSKSEEVTGARSTKTCFVVGPIGEAITETRKKANWLLKGVIEPTFKLHFPEFKVVRSDGITEPGMIDHQMIEHLLDSELVIADMSEHNANAFYEMGIRHMTGNPIIHMFRKGTVIPFDVKSYRAIEFDLDDVEGMLRAQSDLGTQITETMKPGYKSENPVTRARAVTKISTEATPEMKLIWGELESIKSSVQQLTVPRVRPSEKPDRKSPVVEYRYQLAPLTTGDLEQMMAELKQVSPVFMVQMLNENTVEVSCLPPVSSILSHELKGILGKYTSVIEEQSIQRLL